MREIKRVTVDIARKLKELGYPQEQDYDKAGGWYTGYSNYYFNVTHEYHICHEREHIEFHAPYYFEVWMWLKRYKSLCIEITRCDEDTEGGAHGFLWEVFSTNDYNRSLYCDESEILPDDQEEALIRAITYLIENNIID